MKLVFTTLFVAICFFATSQAFRTASRYITKLEMDGLCLNSTPFAADAAKERGRERRLTTPPTISEMMSEAAAGVLAAQRDGVSLARIEIPLPITGATDLDDWPGGILQKYATLRPMLMEMMKVLNFRNSEIVKRVYVGDEETEGVGIWSDKNIQIVSFPTPSSIQLLQKAMAAAQPMNPPQEDMSNASNDANTASMISPILTLVNHQFFLDPLSKDDSKRFLKSAEVAYMLENLSMRGPGSLPVRGLVYRQYPKPFQVARRLDKGGYVVIATYDVALPPRADLEKLFYEDSEERDKDIGFFDRIKRQVVL